MNFLAECVRIATLVGGVMFITHGVVDNLHWMVLVGGGMLGLFVGRITPRA